MTQPAPSRFLQRIAAYPEPIQEALRTEVTETRLADYLRVLHDSPPDRSALTPGGNPILVDTMLSRLVMSKRFIARVRQFEKHLLSTDPAAQSALAEFITITIAPLADPALPYYYKLTEAVQAEELGQEKPQDTKPEAKPDTKQVPAQAGAALTILVAFLGIYRQVQKAAGSVDTMLAQLILEAGSTGQVEALNSVMVALGQPLSFRAQAPEPAEAAPVVSREMAVAFLRQVLRLRFDGQPALAPVDSACLRAIFQTHALLAPGLLRKPAPLDVVLEGAASAQDDAQWKAPLTLGLVRKIEKANTTAPSGTLTEAADPAQTESETGQLTLHAGMAISPIALAWLSCVELAGSGAVQIEARRQQRVSGWASEIVGYIEEEDALEAVGLYRRLPAGAAAGSAAAAIRLTLAQPFETDRPHGRRAPPALLDSYALILRHGGKNAVVQYTNLECCAVFDSLGALLAACADAPARLRKKPVVILGSASPAKASYIIDSVTKFWAYGGRYTTTNVLVQYQGETSKILLGQPDQDQLIRVTAASASTLPLDAILRDPDGFAQQLGTGLLLQGDGFGLCHHSHAPISEDAISQLQRDLSARPLTVADHERLFLTGTPDVVCLAPHDTIGHWPVEHILSDILQKHQQLQMRLAGFPAAPTVQAANQILQQLDLRSSDTLNLARHVDAFALALSEHPALMLELASPRILSVLLLARHTPSADRIAANLAAYAQDICLKDFDLIIPLFEFLACALPANALQAAISFAAMARTNNRRHMFRLAEVARRYGDTAVMVQFLTAVKRNDPDLLKEPQFARNFQLLLGSGELAVMRNILGREALEHIEATISFRRRFTAAVLSADRRAMRALTTDPIKDFMPWMDGLRALSNELRSLQLDGFAMLGISGLHRRKLAATIFADKTSLAGFAAQAFLDSDSDLDVIAQHTLGNSAPLNAVLARKCAQGGVAGFQIAGDSTAAVFRNAAAQLATSPAQTSAETALVSVIISAFNPDIDLLDLSIRSVLAQSHTAVEIFLVDDASTLESSRAIQQLLQAFPQVDYTRLEVNSGPYIGRNLAIAKSRGSLIAIQDADDWSHPARFASQIAAFAANPALRLVTTEHIRIDRHGGVQMEAGFSLCGDGPMTSMFRRDVFDEIGGFAQIRSRGDVEMRERLRAYYGNHAIGELPLPGMLCFADSATLSQKTKSEAAEYLQLFRSNISQRRSLSNLRRDGARMKPEHNLLVPMALRAPATIASGDTAETSQRKEQAK